jgi:hypothetical protein
MQRLFGRLVGFYGARFADMWANSDEVTVRGIWASGLSAVTLDQIRVGIDACLSTKPFPPTLPEFRLLCLSNSKGREAVHVSRPTKDAATDAARDECLQLLGSMNFAPPSRRWAHRLHERHQAGEKLSTIQVALYRKALDLDGKSEAA